MILNLGCGDHRAEGWVNVDRWRGPGVSPDVRADAVLLPFADGVAEAVYCGHLLEHLDLRAEVPALLQEVRRVLAVDGRLCVVGPDHDKALANPKWHSFLPGIRDGGGRWAGDVHQWISTGPRTLAAVSPLFPMAREVELDTLGDWPLVSDIGWQFAIVA